MNNFGTTVAKIAMLAGGAVIGAYLARLCDEWLASRSHSQAEYDKTRYSQGLGAVVLPPVEQPQTPFQQSDNEQDQYNDYR